MSLTHEQAARRLGMKTSEVTGVEEVDAGHEVTTHDGQRVLVTEDAVLPIGVATAEAAVPEAAEVASEEDVAALHAKLQAAGGTGDDDLDNLVLAVPQGPNATVLEWVGDDSQKAAAALVAEQASASPRSTLIAALEKLVTP